MLSIIAITIILILILWWFSGRSVENYSDVSFPLDHLIDHDFLVKIPYETRYYNKNNYSKDQIGYYKTYPDYFRNPKKLKDFRLGYSISGFPYSDYKFNKSIRSPTFKHHYPKWFDYSPQKYKQRYPLHYYGKQIH